MRHERDIHHRRFIHDQQITVQRVGFIAAVAATCRLYFQQSVDGFSFNSGGFK